MAKMQLIVVFLIAMTVAAETDKEKEKLKEEQHKKHEDGKMKRHDHWHCPHFLKNATDKETACMEFKKIANNKTLAKSVKESEISAFIATQNIDVKEAFAKFQTEYAAKVAALSKEAKTAYDAIEAIKDNQTLEESARNTQVKAFKKTLPDEVRKELKKLKNHHKSGHGHKQCEHKDGEREKGNKHRQEGREQNREQEGEEEEGSENNYEQEGGSEDKDERKEGSGDKHEHREDSENKHEQGGGSEHKHEHLEGDKKSSTTTTTPTPIVPTTTTPAPAPAPQ